MKQQRESEIRGLQSPSDGNPVVKSTKQKQLEYLKQIKFNGFTST
jgi:gamma-tubulin complex component 3